MTKYVAILRGINVGGRRKLLMKDLKELCNQLQLENVLTYIQSGNVIFESNAEPITIEENLKKEINDHYGYDVPVIVISLKELIKINRNNPYHSEPNIKQLHYTFLAREPEPNNVDLISNIAVGPDQFQISTRVVYINCVKDYSSTKLTNDFFEKKLKVTATTRNAKTVNKLIELGS